MFFSPVVLQTFVQSLPCDFLFVLPVPYLLYVHHIKTVKIYFLGVFNELLDRMRVIYYLLGIWAVTIKCQSHVNISIPFCA